MNLEIGPKYKTCRGKTFITKMNEKSWPEGKELLRSEQHPRRPFTGMWYSGRRCKIDLTKNYKFDICYENTKNVRGYISERIFDAFAAGCIPIYWGATNIKNYIPENCYILRDKFANNQELYNFMKNLSEQEYQKYITNIKLFLKSDQAKTLSTEYYIQQAQAVLGTNKIG